MRLPFRSKKGEFDPSVVFFAGGTIVILILMMVYIFAILFPESVLRFW